MVALQFLVALVIGDDVDQKERLALIKVVAPAAAQAQKAFLKR